MIQSARVHLVLPRRELFTRERQVPSASIVVKLRGAGRLATMQVASIQHLVASAVPDLTPARVSVIDTEGNLLARGDGGGADGALSGTSAEEMRVNYENRLSRKLEELIDRSVGPGKARVDVHVDMDFDRVTTNSESYDPNGQVVRSTQTVTESNDSSDGGAAAQPVSVANNLPNNQPAPSAPASSGRARGSRSEETVNYEITKTVQNQVREAGQIKRQSVAVVVERHLCRRAGRNQEIRGALGRRDEAAHRARALGHRLRREARRFRRGRQHALCPGRTSPRRPRRRPLWGSSAPISCTWAKR